MKPTPAKIIHHSQGLGTPSAEMVRQRAVELALIDGRDEFNDQDWQAAKRELHGGHESNDTNGEMTAADFISEHDMVVASVGHHTENIGPEDQDNVLEELVAEGMDEAVHDQMLAARRESDAEGDFDEEE